MQAASFAAVLRGADVGARVPTCPEWTIEDASRHLGGALRRIEMLVRTRARALIPEEAVPEFAGPGGDDAAALAAWLEDGAGRAAATFREAGPDLEVWSWAPVRTSAFWARRALHETVIHRADVAIAAGTAYELDPRVAVDTVEEWLEISGYPMFREYRPQVTSLLGADRTLRLHGTDADGAEWIIDVGGDAITWRRGHEPGTVAVRGPVRDVLLVLYRRLPIDSESVEVVGDRGLLEEWLDAVSFG